MKYSMVMALAKLTNMYNNSNLEQGAVCKYKFDQADKA